MPDPKFSFPDPGSKRSRIRISTPGRSSVIWLRILAWILLIPEPACLISRCHNMTRKSIPLRFNAYAKSGKILLLGRLICERSRHVYRANIRIHTMFLSISGSTQICVSTGMLMRTDVGQMDDRRWSGV
jgi:hypothetical protein